MGFTISEFFLVVAIYTGLMLNVATGVSVTTLPIAFQSIEECKAAGSDAVNAIGSSAKSISFACVKRTVASPTKG